MKSNKATFKIEIPKDFLDKFAAFPEELQKAVRKGLYKVTDLVYRGVDRDRPSWVNIKKEVSDRAIDSKWGWAEAFSEGTKSKDEIGKGVITTDDWTWVFAEYGASHHYIELSKEGDKKVLSNLTTIFGKEIDNHPGVPAQPFVRKNIDENKDKAKKIIYDEIVKAWMNIKSTGGTGE